MPRGKWKLWLARDSAGALHVLSAPDAEEAYRVYAREVQGLDTSGDFDVGNVDIDLCELPELKSGKASPVTFEG